MKYELGSLAEDKVTGFKGTLTGFVKYLTGCDQYLIAPKVDKEGKHIDAKWYDVNRIRLLEATPSIKLDTEEDKGACELAPTK